MGIGKDCAIFMNINSDKYTDEEKVAAIHSVVEMPTHNGVTKDSMLEVIKYALRRNAEDDKAREEGRNEKLALAMRAGARAIMQNKRYHCATYVYDVFGAGKEISYFEAANLLCQEAEAALSERGGADV